MRLFILLNFLFAVPSFGLSLIESQLLGTTWYRFKLEHSKRYLTATEELKRLKIFAQNFEKIIRHNKLHDNGKVGYEMGINQFADMTPMEFLSYVNKYKLKRNTTLEQLHMVSPAGNLLGKSMGSVKLPKTVDWRQQNAVSEVKNQGKCGSCWSFSATGALEGQMGIHWNKLVSLSEQNLIDCADKTYENLGCSGGLMTNGYKYLQNGNNGLESEFNYPYEEKQGVCRYSQQKSLLNVDTFVNLPEGDEDALKEAVASIGPISCGIDATIFMQFYKRGVYHDAFCSSEALNHGVLIVGYGTENNQDYWLVKNSWGPVWGEQGFIKMRRNKNNQCGIATLCSYATIKQVDQVKSNDL